MCGHHPWLLVLWKAEVRQEAGHLLGVRLHGDIPQITPGQVLPHGYSALTQPLHFRKTSFDTVSFYVAQAGLELQATLLIQLPSVVIN